MQGLRVRKLADTTDGERVKRFHPETGQSYLADPETLEPKPWPLLGIQFDGEAPDEAIVPTSWVMQGKAEGWIELEGERVEHRPGGPPEDTWRVTHTFVHADAVVIKTVDGDVRYRVTHNPDKYADSDDDAESVTREIYAAGATRVDWFYRLKLDKGRAKKGRN